MLEIKKVCKSYGNKEILKNIDLKVEKGEIVCLLGKNGAGKTSLLNIISNINPSDKGHVFINGYNISKDSEKAKQNLGYVADETNALNYLTGIEFLQFITDIFKIKDSNYLIKKYVSLFEIEDDLNKLISSYSLGMKKKIMIISCLIHNPDVIIMDEPNNGLDIDMRSVLFNEIKKISKDKAILISTHDELIVESLCDKVAIIKDGEIKNFNTIKALKRDYRKNSISEVFKEVHKK